MHTGVMACTSVSSGPQDPVGLLAFQGPEQEEHEGNEGHEELLAARKAVRPRLGPAGRLAFLTAKGEGHEGLKEKEEKQINGNGLCWHLGAESLAPRPQ